MDLTTDELLRVAFDAVTEDRAEISGALGTRVLAGAVAGDKAPQHPGWADPEGDRPSSLRAFITTAAELAALLDTLAPEDWPRATRVQDVTVRKLVEHLVGAERYLLGQIGRRPGYDAPTREDHWPVTRLAVTDLVAEPDELVARAWWLEVLGLVAACAELGPDHELAYYHLAGTLRGLLVVRTFELWTHGDDIRRAVGRDPDLLDEARLSLMVDELMRVLPLGLALSDCARPGRTARIELTGPGGGRFDVPLAPGEPAGDPDIILKATAIDLCRVASNRLAPEEFAVMVDGDARLLDPVLVGAAAFAAD